MGSQPTRSFLETSVAQHHNGADIIEMGNGNHTGIVTELYIDISTFC